MASPIKLNQTHTSAFYQPANAQANGGSRMHGTLDSPIRVKRGLDSPAHPGGFQLNSPFNNHATIGDTRENNRVTGFGPGMASALIGNNNRLKGGKFVMSNNTPRTELGTIGWGVSKPNLDQGVRRRILPEMPHKKVYDFGGLKDLPQMDTVGYQA